MIESPPARRLIRNLLLAALLPAVMASIGKLIISFGVVDPYVRTPHDLLGHVSAFVLNCSFAVAPLAVVLLLSRLRRGVELALALLIGYWVLFSVAHWFAYRPVGGGAARLAFVVVLMGLSASAPLAALLWAFTHPRDALRPWAAQLTRTLAVAVGLSASMLALNVIIQAIYNGMLVTGAMGMIECALQLAWPVVAIALAPALFRGGAVRVKALGWLLALVGAIWLGLQAVDIANTARVSQNVSIWASKWVGCALFILQAAAPLAQMAVLYAFWRGELRRDPDPRLDDTIPICIECGYNLTGNTSGRCPECGTPATRATWLGALVAAAARALANCRHVAFAISSIAADTSARSTGAASRNAPPDRAGAASAAA